MRKIYILLTILGISLRIALLTLNFRARFRPYFPYIQFTWKHRQEMRDAWQEIQAIRSNLRG